MTGTASQAAFIQTKEHRRFAEFASAVRKDRYIGLCFGAAGVGKTLSARRVAHWDEVGELLTEWGPRGPSDAPIFARLSRTRTIFYTPSVRAHLKQTRDQLDRLERRLSICVEQKAAEQEPAWLPPRVGFHTELVIIDEAERLDVYAIEHLRDLHDRHRVGVILIGMPGIERRMERYPQLYSRVGFAHHYRPLQGDELTFVLTRHWRRLGLALDEADFTDVEAMATIARITGGNFRLLQRLFVQIGRILKINDLTVITSDVVEAARSTLVIGAA